MPVRRYLPETLVGLLEALHCPIAPDAPEDVAGSEELDLTWEDIGPALLPPPRVLPLTKEDDP